MKITLRQLQSTADAIEAHFDRHHFDPNGIMSEWWRNYWALRGVQDGPARSRR